MYDEVKSYADKYHMFDGATAVVAGVSGGADSVCLLLILTELSRSERFSLTAVHVEHGIRGEESLGDAAFTEELCAGLGVDFKKYSVDAPAYSAVTGQTLEEAARHLRYECFLDACHECGADRVAVAHNADDCAETMLFNLARGTGIRGMGGIRPVSGMEDICIVRPLLNITGHDIREWLRDKGQPWREDSTNADDAYARNRIRLNVIPELQDINSRAVPHMADAAGSLREICDFLDEESCRAGRGAYSINEDDDGQRGAEIYCDGFANIPAVLQKHLVLDIIGEVSGSRKDITSGHVGQVLDLIAGTPGRRVSLPGGTAALRTADRVILGRGTDKEIHECAEDFDVELAIPGETTVPGGIVFKTGLLDFDGNLEKIPKKTYTKWFDYDRIKNAVHLRVRRTGDYLQTTAEGGHRRLKQYFTDEKIPVPDRCHIPLLADGDHIIWVVGHRISEAYKVTDSTGRVLSVEAIVPDSDKGGT